MSQPDEPTIPPTPLGPSRSISRRALFLLAASGSLAGGIAAWWLKFGRQRKSLADPQPVAALDAVPPDGMPRPFVVQIDDPQSFWPGKVPAGTVFVSRQSADAAPRCWSARCPHQGCEVAYNATRNEYGCPCHDSKFTTAGQRISGPSPRDLDPLDCRVTDGQIWVLYARFPVGEPKG